MTSPQARGARARPGPGPPRRSWALRRLAASLFLLELGSSATLVGLPLLVFGRYGLGWETGLVLGLRLLPNILLGAVAGEVVTRFDPRRVAVIGALAGAALVALIPLSGPLWQVQLLAVGIGVADLVGEPSRMVLRPAVMVPGQETTGNGLLVSGIRLGALLGPAAAGPVVGLAGVAWLFVAESITALLAGALVLGLPRPARPPDPGDTGDRPTRPAGPGRAMAALVSGPAQLTRLLRADRVVAALTGTSFLYVGAVGLGRVFLSQLALTRLPEGASAYGYLLAGMGAGATLGGAAAALCRTLPAGRLFVVANVAEGVLWTATPFVSPLPVLVALMVLVGLLESAATVVYFAEVQKRLAPEQTGRYYALLRPLTDVFSAAGFTLGGPLVAAAGLTVSGFAIAAAVALPVIVLARPLLDADVRPADDGAPRA